METGFYAKTKQTYYTRIYVVQHYNVRTKSSYLLREKQVHMKMAKTYLIPILAKTSSHWNDFPWPFPPHMPKIKGTLTHMRDSLGMYKKEEKTYTY